MKKRNIILLLLFLVFLIGIILNPISFVLNKSEVYVQNIDKSPIVDEVSNTVNKEPIIVEEVETNISNISLLAVGDIMFHTPQINAAKTGLGTYDFNPAFKHVKKYIEAADIAIGNFETVTVGNAYGFSGFPRFNSPIETISALKNAGFDILSTANNHSLDQGKEGIINTIDVFNENGLKNIGTTKDIDRPILIEEKDGIRLGFISYTYGLNGLDSLLPVGEGYMINILNEDLIKEDIKTTKDLGVDMTIVYIHWGYEYHREPSGYQMELAKKMVEWGANIILGSHPHTIQKTEIIEFEGRDNFVIYSMGNFLSNQRYDTMGNSYTEDGLMIQLDIEKDNLTKETIINKISFIPTWVHKYKNENRYNYEILPIEEILGNNTEIAMIESLLERLNKSYSDTINTLGSVIQ